MSEEKDEFDEIMEIIDKVHETTGLPYSSILYEIAQEVYKRQAMGDSVPEERG